MHTELATVPDFTLQRQSRQPGDSEGLFVLMQADFWNTLAKRANEIEAAINANDSAALSELVNDLAECLSGIEPGLNLNIGGPDPFHLAIIPLPGAEQVAETFLNSSTLPDNWERSVGFPEFDPIELVLVEDEKGEVLSVKYGEIDAKVLPPQMGMITIVFSLDTDFDPSGPRAHLYQAVAENVVFTVLGGWPQELAKAVLLPRCQTGNLLPLEQLRQQWVDIVGSERSP